MGKVSSFWALSAMGVLGSIDEGAVGVSYPFLEIPVLWIIVAVILANTVLILFSALLSNWIKNLSRKFPSILSGIILVILGILKFLELILEFKMLNPARFLLAKLRASIPFICKLLKLSLLLLQVSLQTQKLRWRKLMPTKFLR